MLKVCSLLLVLYVFLASFRCLYHRHSTAGYGAILHAFRKLSKGTDDSTRGQALLMDWVLLHSLLEAQQGDK